METQAKTPYAILAIFYALGIAMLLPYNFLITADGYWQYKLRNVSLEDDWNEPGANLTSLQLSFMPNLVIISNFFCTASLILTSFVVNRISEWIRHVGSLGLSLVAMIVITIFTLVNTDSWQLGFYSITMILVALLNIAVAVVQASSYGLTGLFPEVCMSGMVSGQAMAGIFSSLAMIVSLLVGGDPVTSALIFFLIADVTLLLTIAGYIYLTKTEYYAMVKSSATENEFEDLEDKRNDITIYITVLKKVWLMGLTCGGTLLVTLSVYPAVLVYITSLSPQSEWTEVYFQPTITFLLFNVGDFLGREFTKVVKWPGPDGWMLHIFGATRIVFIPLLMLCHGDNKTFPTLFYHDAYYIVILLFFAFTNGYVMTLTMIYYPSLVEEKEIEQAGTIMAAMLGIEMVIGSLISPALVALWGPT